MNKTTEGKRLFGISSAALHILAMLFMLLDHMWATVVPGNEWMTCVGRVAFPIFAFMIVEGFFRTHDLKKYLLRLFIFALLSEIPFNLMYSSQVFYPFHQNVLWTFLIALGVIIGIEKIKRKNKLWLTVLCAVGLSLLGIILGFAAFTDYNGFGVATVLVFYFFRGKKWWCFAGQFLCLLWINCKLLSGLYYPVSIFGLELDIIQQGFAVLALIPIWLYNGRQGIRSKAFRLSCYAFYPVHMLVLALIVMLG